VVVLSDRILLGCCTSLLYCRASTSFPATFRPLVAERSERRPLVDPAVPVVGRWNLFVFGLACLVLR
jgi:hypothetical protein